MTRKEYRKMRKLVLSGPTGASLAMQEAIKKMGKKNQPIRKNPVRAKPVSAQTLIERHVQAIKQLLKKHPKAVTALKNPTLAIFGANPPKGDVMSKRVTEVRYVHIADGQAYRHPFKPGVKMLALPNGAVYLCHPSRRLWNEF
jgi:hypothetical protein